MSTKIPLVVNDTTGIPTAIQAPDTIDPAYLPSAAAGGDTFAYFTSGG